MPRWDGTNPRLPSIDLLEGEGASGDLEKLEAMCEFVKSKSLLRVGSVCAKSGVQHFKILSDMNTTP